MSPKQKFSSKIFIYKSIFEKIGYLNVFFYELIKIIFEKFSVRRFNVPTSNYLKSIRDYLKINIALKIKIIFCR